MAKIVSNNIAILISRIAKEDQQLENIVTPDMVTTLEEVVQQLVGEGAVVEVKQFED